MTTSAPVPDPRARRLRLSGSILIAAATLGPVLVGSAVVSQRDVRNAADAVLQAEARGWARAVDNRLRELGGVANPEVLRSFLEESREAGLRYVARVGRDGRIEAGAPAGPLSEGDLHFGTTWVKDRVRFVVPGGRFGPPRGPRPPPLAGAPDGPPSRPPLRLSVLEFEPQVFPQLLRAANRTLTLGVATAAAMIVLAFWVWQAVRRRYAVEREAERARHLAALGEMSAVLAHEIRNPLSSLKGHAQLLAEGLRGPPGPELDRSRTKAARIIDEAVRIERITTDLLDFVRQGDLHRSDTDLGALVRLSVEEVIPPERLRLTVPATPLPAPVDGPRLRQVIENIARNAVQSGDGPVEIALAREGESAVLTVRDHGPGIPEGQAERIFEPFVTTRTRGTGLGLSIARRIVERHGGTVVAGNHPQGGALFRVALPYSR